MGFTIIIVNDLERLRMLDFSKRSDERMSGVHGDLITIFNEALKNSPIDFGIPEYGGLRTAEGQNSLFLKGLSQCDGFDSKSYHQTGKALDFYAYVNGKASWEKHHLAMVAGVILSTAKRLKKSGRVSVELTWGGTFGSDDFTGWDMPHMQVS